MRRMVDGVTQSRTPTAPEKFKFRFRRENVRFYSSIARNHHFSLFLFIFFIFILENLSPTGFASCFPCSWRRLAAKSFFFCATHVSIGRFESKCHRGKEKARKRERERGIELMYSSRIISWANFAFVSSLDIGRETFWRPLVYMWAILIDLKWGKANLCNHRIRRTGARIGWARSLTFLYSMKNANFQQIFSVR